MDTKQLCNKRRKGKLIAKHSMLLCGGIRFLLRDLHNRCLDSIVHDAILPNAHTKPLRSLIRRIAQWKRIHRHEAHSSVPLSTFYIGRNVISHLVPAPALAWEESLHAIAFVHKLHLNVVTVIPLLVQGARSRTRDALPRLHHHARRIRSDGKV